MKRLTTGGDFNVVLVDIADRLSLHDKKQQ